MSGKQEQSGFLVKVVSASVFLLLTGAFLFVFSGFIDYAYTPTDTPIIFPDQDLFTTNDGVQEHVVSFLTHHGAAELIPIIGCESGFRHFGSDGSVLKNQQGSSAIGVAQIMSSLHPDPQILKRYNRRNRTRFSVEDFDINTFVGNIRYALVLYEIRGVRDWECAKQF
tara:strand:- start:359 stop:862 length:504 start_codon:yes stop_codon:yes gene_type:complete